MLLFVLFACVVGAVPLQSHAFSTAEIEGNDFLDLVDGEGNMLIETRGVDAVRL